VYTRDPKSSLIPTTPTRINRRKYLQYIDAISCEYVSNTQDGRRSLGTPSGA